MAIYVSTFNGNSPYVSTELALVCNSCLAKLHLICICCGITLRLLAWLNAIFQVPGVLKNLLCVLVKAVCLGDTVLLSTTNY